MQSPELSKDSETSTVVLESLKIILGEIRAKKPEKESQKGTKSQLSSHEHMRDPPCTNVTLFFFPGEKGG